jgi:hypothetical protein
MPSWHLFLQPIVGLSFYLTPGCLFCFYFAFILRALFYVLYFPFVIGWDLNGIYLEHFCARYGIYRESSHILNGVGDLVHSLSVEKTAALSPYRSPNCPSSQSMGTPNSY